MSEKIVVPVLGESITEATVAKWLKNTGDAVEADEPIVELETDKFNKLFEGIHPTFKHVPPRDPLDSIHAVFNPSLASLIAQTYPPGPPPITTA